MPRFTYVVKVRRFHAPTDPDQEETGFIPVTLRQLYLDAVDPGPMDPVRVRVTRYVRGGDVGYCFSEKRKPKEELWPYPRFRPDPPLKWKKVESVDEHGCLCLLARYIGEEAVCALNALLTTPPPKKGEDQDPDYDY